MTAKIDFINFKTNLLIETFPLASEFVFSNIYSTYKGDKRACEDTYYSNFDRRVVPFSSSEQIIFDTGNDSIAKLKVCLEKKK